MLGMEPRRLAVLRRIPCGQLLLAVLVGTIADRWWRFPILCSWCVGVLAWGLAWCFLRNDNRRCSVQSRRRSVAATVCLLLGIAASAAAWHHGRWYLLPVRHIARLARGPHDQLPVCVRGSVLALPTVAAETGAAWRQDPGPPTRFPLRVTQLFHRGSWRKASGKAWVRVAGPIRGPDVGELVQVTGLLSCLRGPDNPGQVDFRPYQQADGFHVTIRVPRAANIRRFPAGRWQRFWPSLAKFRATASQTLQRRLDAQVAPLASAILLGIRQELPSDVRTAFTTTGTVHLLAISGLHAGILASVFLFAAQARLAPFRPVLMLTILLVAAYAQLTEARAPVVRASILVQIICWSWMLRRRPRLVNSLAVAGLVVIAFQPADLFFPGTQLSFIAVAALGRIGGQRLASVPADPLDRLVWRTRPWWRRRLASLSVALRRMLLASVAVWFVTTPLVWHHHHLVSPIAVPLNLVLWLPLTSALLSGMALIVCDVCGCPGAACCGWSCQASLHGMLAVVRWASQLPGGHFWLPSPGVFATSAFYVCVLLAWTMVPRRRWRWTYYACGLALLVGTLTARCREGREARNDLQLTFLAVGHGSCVVLRLPDGQTWLYDAGRLGATELGVDWVARYLWSQGVRRVDRVILSHMDTDHYSLLPGLFERFRVGRLASTWMAAHESQAALMRLHDRCRTAGIMIERVRAGLAWQIEDARLSVQHPQAWIEAASDNANSLVLLIEFRGRRALLTGDVEGIGLAQLLNRPQAPVDLAMAPHHGSAHSNPTRFLRWCRPKWLIVSGGEPIELARFAARQPPHESPCVLQTATQGAISVKISGSGQLTVSHFHPSGSTIDQGQRPRPVRDRPARPPQSLREP